MKGEQLGLWGGPVKPREPRATGPRGPRKVSQPLDDLTPESRNPQLPMFMSPKEIHTQYQITDGDRLYKTSEGLSYKRKDLWDDRETHQEMWDRKNKEADESGLTASVAKRGVIDPIQLQNSSAHWPVGTQNRFQIMDGNHRLAAAQKVNPNGLVPVEHHDYGDEAHFVAYNRVEKRKAAAQERKKAQGQRAGYAQLLAALQQR